MQNRPKFALSSETGFSMIEIISMLLVLGIIAAVVFPMFNRAPIAVSTAAVTVKDDILFVQDLAMSRQDAPANVGIVFTAGASSYIIDDPNNVYDQVRDLQGGVRITGGGSITFDIYGEPVIRNTITITSGSVSKSISVEKYTGRVTIS